jgi:penicillin amidase
MKPIRIKHSLRPFTAHRDENGVPHIHAPTWRDALYGLGFMHALDRPTQLLFSRTVAGGQTAEMIADKPAMADTDRFFRRAGLARNLGGEATSLSEEHLDDLISYCHGVNAGMRQAGRSLPMWATGYQPQPWDIEAVMLIGNLLNFGGLAVGQQQNERLVLELIQLGVDDDRLRELFSPLLDDVDFELLRRVKISNRLSDEALELITDLPRLAGSNAWVVAPQRSATGSALLASDPHLEVNRLPSIWYEAVLHWDGHYLMGSTLAGCPTFAVGRTRQLAWGVTYLKGDTSDYFIEDCRRGEHGWQYRRGEEWFYFQTRDELIHHKGKQQPETLVVRYNDLGTLDGDPEATGEGLYLLTAWTGDRSGVGRSVTTWLDLVSCNATLEAMDLVRQCPQPTLCWLFADRAGHIGMQTNGWFPKRRPGHSGLTPVPAWDERNHWQGLIPVEELPRAYDPPEGFIASANENIDPPGGPMLTTQPVPDYRKRRIVERLQAMDRATVKDMQALQYDVISLQARDLLEIFLPHMPDGEVKDRLTAWDCGYGPQSREATLFYHLYRNVLLEVFGQEPGQQGGIGWRRMLYLSSRAGFSMMVITCVDRLLHQEKSRWWRVRDKGELIRRAASSLNLANCPPWSETNAFRFTNRYFEGQLGTRVLGFQTGDLPMPGCHATPFQGHLLRSATRETTFAPSYHFVTDLATDEAWTNLPGGPSESRFSRWYKSDLPRWCEGTYKRLAGDQSP